MEKETVLIRLLLKPMTKTRQVNNIAIMIYYGGYPVLKLSVPFFAIILMKMTWKRWEWKKIVLLLKPKTKTSQLNGKSREDVFRCTLSPKWPFKMAAWKCLFMDCKYLLE